MNNGENQNMQETPEINDAAVNDTTPAVRPKKNFGKFFGIAAATVATVAAVAVGASALIINFVAMPNPIGSLAKTLEKKYVAKTEFSFEGMKEEGKILADVSFAEDNIVGAPKGTINVSMGYKKNEVMMNAGVYDEAFSLYMSKDAVAAKVEGLADSAWYGVSFKDFRDTLEKSVFGPDSDEDYALDDEVFDALCEFVESMEETDKQAKENKKDLDVLMKFVNGVFKDSDISDTDNDYGTKEIMGEKRWARSEIYTINEDTLQDFLEKLAEEMDDADKKVRDAADRLLDQLNNSMEMTLGEKISWNDLVDLVEMAAEECELGDVEIKVEMCYTKTYVTAILASVESEDADVTANITIDFGKNPVKSMDTTIYGVLESDGVEMEAKVVLDEEVEGKTTTYTLSGELDAPNYDLSAEAVLALERGGEATLDVSYTDADGEKIEVLNAVCSYVDTKDTWSLTFKEFTFQEKTVTAEDLGMTIQLALFADADSMSKPKFENVLEWKNSDVEDFIEDMDAFIKDVEERYNIGAVEDPAA